MQLRLKESPKEWLKFTAVVAVLAVGLASLLYRRQDLPAAALKSVLGTALATVVVCALRPRWFRGFYRCGMTASFHVGQLLGRVMLTLFFLFLLTPLGLLLRLLGKDLLQLKRRRADSYWQAAREWGPLDRMF